MPWLSNNVKTTTVSFLNSPQIFKLSTKPSPPTTLQALTHLFQLKKKKEGGRSREKRWYGDTPSVVPPAIAPWLEESLDTTSGSLKQGWVPRSLLLPYVSTLGLSQTLAYSWLQKSYSQHFNCFYFQLQSLKNAKSSNLYL